MHTPYRYLLPALLVIFIHPLPLVAQIDSEWQASTLGFLKNKEIKESSGLAISRIREDVLWTHNDSGNKRRLYAVNLKGQDVATCKVKGAEALDWEDMASFEWRGQPYLLVADTGDNSLKRDSYQLYVIPESFPDDEKLHVAATWEFRYPDGPQNCEAVAVDPDSGLILLVIKDTTPSSAVHVLPLPDGVQSADLGMSRPIGTVAVTTVTAADISADGRWLIVTTYFDAMEFERSPGEEWSTALTRPGRPLRLPPRIQGESVAYDKGAQSFFLTSEKRPTPLFRMSTGRIEGTSEPSRVSKSAVQP